MSTSSAAHLHGRTMVDILRQPLQVTIDPASMSTAGHGLEQTGLFATRGFIDRGFLT
jgi:hypothetical protein